MLVLPNRRRICLASPPTGDTPPLARASTLRGRRLGRQARPVASQDIGGQHLEPAEELQALVIVEAIVDAAFGALAEVARERGLPGAKRQIWRRLRVGRSEPKPVR